MRQLSALLAGILVLALPPAAAGRAGDLSQTLNTDGLEIHYGIVPAAVVEAHRKDDAERAMHSGVPRRAGQHHLTVALFDARTHERVERAEVWATVTELGLAPNRKKLEPMRIAGETGYGNYFAMAAPGPYRIRLDVAWSRG
ncbi:MAG TPA: hypothetical protein VFI62_08620, partial [Burkholderiales bacterium]|nr:hypothetical protein [Burkholderiales bacterium]